MALDYRKCAEEIFSHLGGRENIISAAHCATRLDRRNQRRGQGSRRCQAATAPENGQDPGRRIRSHSAGHRGGRPDDGFGSGIGQGHSFLCRL